MRLWLIRVVDETVHLAIWLSVLLGITKTAGEDSVWMRVYSNISEATNPEQLYERFLEFAGLKVV